MIVITQKRIYRSDLQKNPKSLFIFGDNIIRQGFGGQAAECRGEPNAHGIATKVSPMEFMSDSEAHMSVVANDIDILLEKLKSGEYNILVIPEDGIGTGLAEMDKYAPALFSSIQMYLNRLIEMSRKVHNNGKES